MLEVKKVILKPGKEKALRQRHPWIFSGAVAELPSFENGEILSVFSAEGQFLAKAYFHRENSIAGRVLTFHDEPIETALDRHFSYALQLRKRLFDPKVTNAYRLINSEGDFLPGFVVDLYDDMAVIQINTCGIERLKEALIARLKKHLKLRGIYEKSQSNARRQEGLPDSCGLLFGECPKEILVKENGLHFLVSIEKGQKTGFFLDQREMRQLLFRFAKNRRVLNCFSYSGGFSLFALQAGASHVVSVDSSEEACRLATENTLINHFELSSHEIVEENVFKYLHADSFPFDLVILDPPAFAKRRQEVEDACRGYKEINRNVLKQLPPSSFLLTCSCSHFVSPELFQQVIFQAAVEANREVVICSRHIQTPDHPISLYHPEGEYLKSLFLHVH